MGFHALCLEVTHFFQELASLGCAADQNNGPFKPRGGTGSVHNSDRGLLRLGLEHGQDSPVQFLLK